MDQQDRQALIQLTITPGLGPVRIGRGLQFFQTPQAILAADAQQLAKAMRVSGTVADRIARELEQVHAQGLVQQELDLIQQAGVTLLTLDDPGYPRLLKLTPDPPPLLYVRGQLQEQDNLALGMVGSRKCSHYGREQADRFAAFCSQAGLCIVSGGAYGIDAAAHQAVLRMGGRTMAVIGSGLNRPYPAAHAKLFDQIAAGCGAVLSELPMNAPPRAEHFPLRNRIISGLSLGVLVVEAALRSGALITARLCAEDHGREVMAIPGRVDSPASAGCHKIIRDGWATLVTTAADVLDALGEAGQLLKADLPDSAAPQQTTRNLVVGQLTATQQTIFDALQQPRSLDQLAIATGLSVSTLQADLTLMEIRRIVQRQGTQYARKPG